MQVGLDYHHILIAEVYQWLLAGVLSDQGFTEYQWLLAGVLSDQGFTEYQWLLAEVLSDQGFTGDLGSG